ncbi:MAG: helix-turn-helix domain-containing protein [Bacteroidetes bacterium]|nr:helix-turn-helix domain-containing protein [Bacteroidota bacterium]
MQLKKQLYNSGLRQNFVAQKVGISDSYLTRILNGTRTPKDQSIIERIKNAIENKK